MKAKGSLDQQGKNELVDYKRLDSLYSKDFSIH